MSEDHESKAAAGDSGVRARIKLNSLFLGALCFALGLLLGHVLTRDSLEAPPAPLDEARLRAIIAEALEGHAAAAKPAEAAPDRFALVDDDPYLGAVDAPVVIVEFSDFFCVYCKRHFDQTFVPLLENYGEHIRYVYRDFARLTPESAPAAAAAHCAYAQGKFWEFHSAFFANQQALGQDFYLQTAEENQLDIEQYTACLEDTGSLDEVDFDGLDGQLAGVQGTPGFFVNGQILSGAQPYRIFERMVQRELDKAGIDYAAVSG
ncbi:MAG: thioredoxin domain-containing protein [Chloroflexi bacterium]|nr:thioredoxin domain-containing protein [Chloroflexota bacterium]MCY3583539.1 thioredoxin domain-containing protein [Chloroflexota bacterium]MCY3717353.1 thioredoxin domain-containing protein [Chloroflexota bacterium]MDE2651861.1 thioredoxin domain-containing protein [Chloroflexota bacterium]MXV92905.1 thioredoxin domain-containing protein [Chloroflexota bacterium]